MPIPFTLYQRTRPVLTVQDGYLHIAFKVHIRLGCLVIATDFNDNEGSLLAELEVPFDLLDLCEEDCEENEEDSVHEVDAAAHHSLYAKFGLLEDAMSGRVVNRANGAMHGAPYELVEVSTTISRREAAALPFTI